ncbi:MAG: hypothetical protein WBA54_12985 [Acidaminobacteraceae bacterium]
MNKKIILVLIISTFALTAMGCQNNSSNIKDTITKDKIVDENKRTQIMEEYELVKTSTTIELAEFIDRNIDLLTTDDADNFLLYFIKRSKDNALRVNSNLIDQKLKSIFGINYGPHAVEDGIEYGVSLIGEKKEIALLNLTNVNDKEYVKELFLRGQTINQYEGEYFLIIDYNYINNKYGDKVSNSLSEYLDIMDKETITPLTSGEYLAVSLEELQNRAVNYENFLTNSGDTTYSQDIKNFYSTALWRILSTPTYFNDFTDDFKLKGSRLDYYNTLINLDTSKITTSAVKDLYDFFYSDSNGLNDLNVDVDNIIYGKEKEIHSAAMLKLEALDNN